MAQSLQTVFCNGYPRSLTLRASLPDKETQNAINYGDKKELVGSYKLYGVRVDANAASGQPSVQSTELVDLRLYMGRSGNASTVYSAVWIKGENCWFSGRGQAGGWGYDKRSQAAGDALSSAGVSLFGTPYGSHNNGSPVDFDKAAHIGGVGETAIESALLALGALMGFAEFILVKS